MKRLTLIIASLAVFIVTSTAQADDTAVRVSPIASPLMRPARAAQMERPVRTATPVNPWAFIWIRWTR